MNKKFKYSTPVDEYEQELEEFINKGEFIPMPKSQFEKHKLEIQEMARRHIENRKSMTIRVKPSIILKIKEKAKKKNISYQTLINLLLGQYANNKIKLAI